MSDPAYHLRPNKAVERALFLELLRKLDPHLPQALKNYRYVGMGGPFLEDFRAIQEAFPGMRMLSLETQRHTRKRQDTNRPHRAIELTRLSTSEFVRRFQTRRERQLVWFDHSKTTWEEQIAEAGSLLSALRNGSIFKITLIPVIKHLCPSPAIEDRLEALNKRFGGYGPFELAHAAKEKFAITLYRILSRAVAEAVPDSQLRIIRPLASFFYADKSPVLTVTMIVTAPSEHEELLQSAGLWDWPFADLDWSGPKEINVPDLSIRERISIDRWLPGCTASGIVRRLRMRLATTQEETIEMVENYTSLSRYMPQFMRVVY